MEVKAGWSRLPSSKVDGRFKNRSRRLNKEKGGTGQEEEEEEEGRQAEETRTMAGRAEAWSSQCVVRGSKMLVSRG